MTVLAHCGKFGKYFFKEKKNHPKSHSLKQAPRLVLARHFYYN